jgi:hypothetical protein
MFNFFNSEEEKEKEKEKQKKQKLTLNLNLDQKPKRQKLTLSSGVKIKGSETLDDLEGDEEFQEVSERFLESVGEQPDDVFEYLRDSDFNIYSAFKRVSETDKFTDQQKQDYAYLRSRFDNADLGSMKQFFGLIKDAGIDIATDPLAILSAIFTPVTGGTSLAARQAVSSGISKGAKAVIKSTAITGAEAGAWTGVENHFRQNKEINVGLRKMYSNPELASSTAIGLLTGGVVGGLVQKNALFNSKMNRLYSNDEYRKDAGSEILFQANKAKDEVLSKTIGSPWRVLKTLSKYSSKASELGTKISDQFSKGITERTRKVVPWAFYENLKDRQGDYIALLDNAIAPIRKTGDILPEDEIAVIRILRGEDGSKYSQEVQDAAKNLRSFFDTIFDDAIEAGLIKEEARGTNYFTRSWNREAIEQNRPAFRQRLIESGGLSEKEIAKVDNIIDGMLNKQNELYSSHSILLTQARTFRNLNDLDFEDFLTNDLIPVSLNYAMNAAKSIQHERTFLKGASRMKVVVRETGEEVSEELSEKDRLRFYKQDNLQRFRANFIDPINKELKEVRGKGLSNRDQKKIEKLYESVTGQVNYYDSGVAQGIYDFTKLSNAIAYLPLATVTSLTEGFIPLTKAPTNSAVKGYQDAIAKGHKIFTKEAKDLLKEKHTISDDELIREMNSVMIAVDESMADFTNRLSGEGLQNEFLKKVARGFYRVNLLVPWTKTVQLAAFSTGKDMIRNNLEKLSKLSKEGVDILEVDAPMKIQRLRGELFDLGIDIEDGIKWFDKGRNTEDAYYRQIIKGAGRFTNSVILPTGREAGRVPLYMTNPKFDILTQFLSYPTVFTNTILKNYARAAVQNPGVNAPKAVAFAAMATSVAKATNYWRSSEEKREEYDNEDVDWRNTVAAMQRVGLLGPLEYAKRYTEAVSYGQGPLTGILNLGGPVLGDVVGMFLYNRGLLETAARKAPLIGVKNIFNRKVGDVMEEYTGFRDPYTPLQKAAKERDKERRKALQDLSRRLSGTTTGSSLFRTDLAKTRLAKFEGGEISEDFPVPNVKKEPSEMINKATGLPYEAEMERLGMEDGGLLVSIGVAPVSEKQIGKLKKGLKKRKAKRDGGEIRQQYAFGDRIKKALKRRGEIQVQNAEYIKKPRKELLIDAKHAIADILLGADKRDIEDLDQRTIDALINNIDKIENEKERTAALKDIDRYEAGTPVANLSSPIFNALRHAKLSYEYGDKPFARSALIAKEQAQSRGIAYKGDFKTDLTEAESRAEKIDALNNVAAFRIKDENPNLDDQQFNEEFIKRFNESANTPTAQLKPGKHFYLRESNAIGVKMPSMFIHPSAKFTN